MHRSSGGKFPNNPRGEVAAMMLTLLLKNLLGKQPISKMDRFRQRGGVYEVYIYKYIYALGL